MESTIRRRLAYAIPAPVVGPLVAALLVAACAAPPSPQTPSVGPRLDSRFLPYLLDPQTWCGETGELARESGEVHRRLVASGDAGRAEDEARALLAHDPGAPAARAALAQALLVAGREREVAEAGALSAAELSACPALTVARGRALELVGDVAGAFGAYRHASPVSPVAAERAAAISRPARDAARAAFSAAMAKGHLEAAAWYLEQLELWWPRSEPALRARLEIAAATHDVERELAAARALHEAASDDVELTLRRARLEIEAGDARTGLTLIQALAAAAPTDLKFQRELARARFEWRLQNSPESVRRLARSPEVTRADLAELVYWMVPRVRTARPAGGRIASDVLDLPNRDEVVRMVNLGLMTVDETLHRFAPTAPLRRGEALRTLLRLLRFLGAPSCGGVPADGAEGPCGAALACALIESESGCSPGDSLSGRELVELLRLALERAGES